MEKEMTVFDMECTKINRKDKYANSDNLDYLDGVADAFIYMRDYAHEIWLLDDADEEFTCFESRLLTEMNRDKLPTSVRMGIKEVFDSYVSEIWSKADEKYDEAVNRQTEVLDQMYEAEMQECFDRHQRTRDFSDCEGCYTPDCAFSERNNWSRA